MRSVVSSIQPIAYNLGHYFVLCYVSIPLYSSTLRIYPRLHPTGVRSQSDSLSHGDHRQAVQPVRLWSRSTEELPVRGSVQLGNTEVEAKRLPE